MKELSEAGLAEFNKIAGSTAQAVISTHAHPDGDAIGSSLALARYLNGRGATVRIVLPDPYPENLSFAVDGVAESFIIDKKDEAETALNGADTLISIDYNSPGRTDSLEEAIRRFKGRKVLIDHHISPETDFYDLVFSETEVSSSCELLYNVLMSMPEIGGHAERLGIEIGTALMLGMTTDSNNFANSTYPSTLEMAGKLIEAGVDRDALLENLYNRYRENRYRFMGHFLSKKMKITEEGVAYAVISAEEIRSFGIKDGETEGFVNMPLGIDTVRMSVFIKEEDNGERFRVSVRSRRGTSANRFAGLYFNGGGHERAAGGRLLVPRDVSGAKQAEEYVERCVKEFFGAEKQDVR